MLMNRYHAGRALQHLNGTSAQNDAETMPPMRREWPLVVIHICLWQPGISCAYIAMHRIRETIMVELVSAPVIMLLALGGTAIAAALYVLIKDTQKGGNPHHPVQGRDAKAPQDVWDVNRLRRGQRESD
jgi:hypothetical protein